MIDIRPISPTEGLALIRAHHGYAGAGKVATYAFGVFESDRLVAYYQRNPPAPGAALSVCPTVPWAVLALTRMVAVPKSERVLKHVSKPLREMQRRLIDRTRWPVLVTYSDASMGHNGYTYKCAGWTATKVATRNFWLTPDGARQSRYTNGKTRDNGTKSGTAVLTRWEHWACERNAVAEYVAAGGWHRVERGTRRWNSGNQAFQIVRG